MEAGSPAISVFFVFLLLFLSGVHPATFTFTNNCEQMIWPGLLSGAGSPPLPTTGFSLDRGESKSIPAPAGWSGRFWARTLCSGDPTAGKFACATADCGRGSVECSGAGASPPATLAEFTLSGAGNGKDFFDVSLVDGYNLPILVAPRGAAGNGSCSATGCVSDLNGACPSDLAVTESGETVACRSACEAFGKPEYCCSGSFANPNTCRPSSFSQLFKNACPRAYSYAYDDSTSTFTCAGGTSYLIVFCPTTASQKSAGMNPQAVPVAGGGAGGGDPIIYQGYMFTGGATGRAAAAISLGAASLAWLLLQLILCH